MINPEEIPQFTGDLAQLELDHAALKKDAGNVRDTGKDVHSQFQGLSAFYRAPEAEQLFATTKPVQDRADDFATHLETVSGALSSYATEIRPLVSKLKELKTKAQTFVDSVKDDDDWEYDGDKVGEHNQIRDDITATVAAFWAAERTCHNKITAIWNGTQMVAGDGSDRKDQYGFNAEDLKNAKLPWGDPVEEKHHWYEVGHWVKSFVWDGLIVDGVWGTIKGLGTLVGFGGWDAMGQAWKGLAQLATGLALASIPGVGTAFWLLPDDKLPSWIRDSRTAMKETGKALVAWDEWGKNPGRAAGAVTFNVLTTVFTGGAGGAAAGAGKAGAVAKVLSVAGKAGKVIDPMTYIAKGAGAGLSKIGDIAKGLKGIGKIEVPTLPDGSVHLPDGRLLEPNGNLVSPDGTIDTTPVPHETAPASYQTPSGLPEHWTTQTPDTPAYAGVPHSADNAAYAGAGHSADNSAYTGAGHTGDGTSHTGAGHPANSGTHAPVAHAPSDGIHGGIPQSTPAATASHGASTSAHATGDGIHGGVPHSTGGGGTYTGGAPVSHGIQGGIPHSTGDAASAGAHSGTTPSAWYHDTPAGGATHDVPTTTPHETPTTTPHTDGHTPDAPHAPGHDAPNGHPHDGSHGAGHTDDATHAGDHAPAGDHAGAWDHVDVGDGAADAGAHHGTDVPVTPGHPDVDVPGHAGAGEPFEYKPLVSADDFDALPDAEKHAVAEAELADGTNPVPSASNKAGWDYGNAYWNDFLDDLPPESRDSLVTYTGNAYDDINSHLRFGTDVPDSIVHTIDEMDKVMGARPVPESIMVVRGTGIDHLHLSSPLDMEGRVFDDAAYTSTALGEGPPPPFDQKPVYMHLRVPEGTPALWLDHLSKYPGERELLLARGTQYKVTRVFLDDAGKWHVYGEVLPRP
ncbi:protein phosphatase [Streptomyces longwoodensis]|uniref:ADP-ribosyltransferase n=1 Tax=Streptomyces longwoodensis TaxID=68231 RepID=UPI002E801503|nr:ADP-ribosyltransferase [Streptomyces longwoodensis]WUC59835.1 protein phosphatase [Streptomyces longwoodensis]